MSESGSRWVVGKASVIVLSVFVLTIIMPPLAQGGLITDLTPVTSVGQNGLTHYQFTLSDDATSTLPVVEFTLSVSTAAALQSIEGPSGWVITYAPGDSVVDWSSFSLPTAIQPGQTGSFSFDSPLSPTSQNFLVVGLDQSFNFDTNDGKTVSPGATAVPEPNSFFLCVTGAALIFTVRGVCK